MRGQGSGSYSGRMVGLLIYLERFANKLMWGGRKRKSKMSWLSQIAFSVKYSYGQSTDISKFPYIFFSSHNSAK